MSAEPLFDAFYKYSKLVIADGEGAMPTAFVCAVEYVDSNGEYWFAVVDDGKSPKWKKYGMLYHAIDEVADMEQLIYELEKEEQDDDE
jgi:hypothetical protein